MRFRQIFTSARPSERLDITIDFLRHIDARASRRVWTGWGWIRNRRAVITAHFIGDRRKRRGVTPQRWLMRLLFLSILVTISTTTTAMLIHAPGPTAALMTALNLGGMLAIVMMNPNKMKEVFRRIQCAISR